MGDFHREWYKTGLSKAYISEKNIVQEPKLFHK